MDKIWPNDYICTSTLVVFLNLNANTLCTFNKLSHEKLQITTKVGGGGCMFIGTRSLELRESSEYLNTRLLVRDE